MGAYRLPFSDPDPDAELCSDLRAKLHAVSVVINGNRPSSHVSEILLSVMSVHLEVVVMGRKSALTVALFDSLLSFFEQHGRCSWGRWLDARTCSM